MIQTLPNNWSQVNLSEIVESINPGFPSGQHNQKAIGIPHLRPMNINSSGELDLSLVKYVEVEKYVGLKKDDILFNNTNSPELLGKTTVIKVNSEFAFSNHMTRIKIKPDLGDSNFIAKYLHFLFIKGFYKANCQNHVNQASISKSFLLNNIPIPLPPLLEQHKIVSKIEELFSELEKGIENLRKAKEQIKTYRQSVLAAAFSGRLTQNKNNIESNDPLLVRQMLKAAEPKVEYGIDSLPEGWKISNLGELKTFSIYGPRFSSKDYTMNGVAVLRTTDINELGKVDWTNSPKLDLSDDDYEKYKLIKNDLLITRTGSIGTISIFNDEVRAIAGAFLIQYRLGNNINMKYIFHFLKSQKAKDHFNKYSSGSGRPNLNVPNIEKLQIPLAPMNIQHKIVEEIERLFSVADKLEQTIDENLNKADLLKQSILKQAFEGKLV